MQPRWHGPCHPDGGCLYYCDCPAADSWPERLILSYLLWVLWKPAPQLFCVELWYVRLQTVCVANTTCSCYSHLDHFCDLGHAQSLSCLQGLPKINLVYRVCICYQVDDCNVSSMQQWRFQAQVCPSSFQRDTVVVWNFAWLVMNAWHCSAELTLQ